MKTRNLR